MRRRGFLATISMPAAPWSRQVLAQSTSKIISRVAVLRIGSPSTTDPRLIAAFQQGLHENGLVEGRNLELEYFWAEGDFDRVRELASKLGHGNFDVIVTATSKAVKMILATGTTTPIVFAVVGEPVEGGIVQSLGRPGGNVTGLSMADSDLESKRVELLKETVPSIRKVMILRDPVVGAATGAAEARAQMLGLGVVVTEPSSADEFQAVFSHAHEQGVDAIAVVASAVFQFHRKQLVELATKYRFASIWESDVYVKEGGLMSYGPNFPDMYRRSAEYVARILKGAKPSDLPVQQPTKFELVVNLQTAKILGVTIPARVIARANEVIE
jgi:putative ABC transport system substrate-binding protein